MARTALTFLFLLAFLQLFPSPGQAAAPAYTVNDVKVDILSESAVKARDKAFGEAQKVAFVKLAERFRSPEAMAGFVPPDARTIAGMVQDFEVVSEQLSTRRYLGTYTFRFKANAVNRYFGGAPSYRSDDMAYGRPAGLMILPFFQQAGADPVLWDAGKNPWLQAWQKTSMEGLLLPLGDASDIMDVRDNQPLTYNAAGLRRMKTRYETRDAAIVFARFDQAQANPLTIEIYRTDKYPPELVKSLPVINGSSRTLGDLMQKTISEVKVALSNNWKAAEPVPQETLAVSEQLEPYSDAVTINPVQPPLAQPQRPQAQTAPLGGNIRVKTSFTTIAEWLATRRALNSVPELTGIRIVALRANEAVVDLNYADWPSLSSGLSARGMSIQGTGVGDYRLVNQVAAAPYR